MTVESPLLDNNYKKWGSRFLKFTFFVIAFGLIFIMILANMGGKSDTLKVSVEKFVSEIFGGRPAVIGTLHNMSFFPKVGVSAENILIMSKAEDGFPIVTIDKLQLYMGFWNVATRDPRFSKFYIENFKAIKGVIGAQEFEIEKAYVDHDIEANTAQLRVNGKIGVHALSLIAGLDIYGSGGKYRYRLQEGFPLQIDLADLHFEGNFINHEANFFRIEDFTLTLGDQSLGGNVVLSALGDQLLKFKADLFTNDHSNVVNLDWVVDNTGARTKLAGDVSAKDIKFDDVFGENHSASSIIARIREVMGYNMMSDDVNDFRPLGSYDLDLAFNVESIDFSDIDARALSFKLKQDDTRISLSPVMSGDVALMPSALLVDVGISGERALILHDGTVDTAFISQWMQGFQGIDILDLSCGIGVIKNLDHHISLIQFNALTAQGTLTSISPTQAFTDTKFKLSGEQSDIQTLTLPRASYDFVQTGLKKSAQGSACEDFITLKPEASDVSAAHE